jgi:hypothetical protein
LEINGAVIGLFACVKSRVQAVPDVGNAAISLGEIQM